MGRRRRSRGPAWRYMSDSSIRTNPLDRRAVEHHLAVERLLELAVWDFDVLDGAEDVGELQPQELDLLLLGRVEERFLGQSCGALHVCGRVRRRDERWPGWPARESIRPRPGFGGACRRGRVSAADASTPASCDAKISDRARVVSVPRPGRGSRRSGRQCSRRRTAAARPWRPASAGLAISRSAVRRSGRRRPPHCRPPARRSVYAQAWSRCSREPGPGAGRLLLFPSQTISPRAFISFGGLFQQLLQLVGFADATEASAERCELSALRAEVRSDGRIRQPAPVLPRQRGVRALLSTSSIRPRPPDFATASADSRGRGVGWPCPARRTEHAPG